MALLATTLYDPAVSVTKSTAALLAMTAIDTTNLRHTFTVPATGRVLVRMGCAFSGASQAASVSLLMGVLNGATVVARVHPHMVIASTATGTSSIKSIEAVFSVGGLTPGASLTWDAAYGVEQNATGSGLRYGGPDDTTTSNAFGGFIYEIWEA